MFDLSTIVCRLAPPRAVASRLQNTSFFMAFRGLLARKMDLMTLTQKTGHSIYKSVCVYLYAKIQKQIQMRFFMDVVFSACEQGWFPQPIVESMFRIKGNDIFKSLYFAWTHVGILVRRNRLRSRISASDAWGSHTALTWPVVLCFLISSSEAYECPFSDPITVEGSAL